MDEFVRKAFEQAIKNIDTSKEAEELFHANMTKILDEWHGYIGPEASRAVAEILARPGIVTRAFYDMAAMFFSSGYYIGKHNSTTC